ncbi:MAG: AraC family transcriptional regulator [Leptotrichiaceae bacterium]|nr:AraC family transcriptional regulator [Leptotrichiaceae bacterium]
MYIIKTFNSTMNYIEETLTGKPDGKRIALLSGYSYPLFSRIFSIMVGYSLNEYIRFRKLSCAAADLRETDGKIIEIAFKYGYESPDSFAAAFKKFHNCTPTEVRNGKAFRIFPPIRLSLNIEGGKNMEIKIEKKDAFKVAGLKAEGRGEDIFQKTWIELFRKVNFDTLEKLGNGQSYGVCYGFENNIERECNENVFEYMAGYDVKNTEKAVGLGLEIIEVPEAEYVVVKLKGPVPDCIHEGWKYVTGVFFPEQGYRHGGTPDFEVYSEGNMENSDYEMELWVPVIKVQKAV